MTPNEAERSKEAETPTEWCEVARLKNREEAQRICEARLKECSKRGLQSRGQLKKGQTH